MRLSRRSEADDEPENGWSMKVDKYESGQRGVGVSQVQERV